MRLTDLEWQTAKTVCTTRQLQVLDLWRRNYGYTRIAIILDTDRSNVQEIIRRGLRRIRAALELAS